MAVGELDESKGGLLQHFQPSAGSMLLAGGNRGIKNKALVLRLQGRMPESTSGRKANQTLLSSGIECPLPIPDALLLLNIESPLLREM